MKKLLEALQIFLKYQDMPVPTHCERNVFYVVGITEEEVSEEDKIKLEELHFRWESDMEAWGSYFFGSA